MQADTRADERAARQTQRVTGIRKYTTNPTIQNIRTWRQREIEACIHTYIHTGSRAYREPYKRTGTINHACKQKHMGRRTGPHTYKHTDRQQQADRKTGIHTYIHTYIQAYIHIYIHTNIQTDRDRQTARQAYIHTYIHTYRHTYIYAYIQTVIRIKLQNVWRTNNMADIHTTYRHTYIRRDIYREIDIHTYIHTYIQTENTYINIMAGQHTIINNM